MKFTIIAAVTLATLASMVSADPAACTLCLQKAIQALPACAGVTPTAGSVSPAYAACLCSSLSGTWANSCKSDAQCGSDISSFQAAYSSEIQTAGLNCANGQSSYNPPSA